MSTTRILTSPRGVVPELDARVARDQARVARAARLGDDAEQRSAKDSLTASVCVRGVYSILNLVDRDELASLVIEVVESDTPTLTVTQQNVLHAFLGQPVGAGGGK